MMIPQIKVLGICGSPVKNGNTEQVLKAALEEAHSFENVETEFITVTGKRIEDCKHCNWCIKNSSIGKYCSIDDEMSEILNKITASDILLFATPVYFTRLSGYMAKIIDRLRTFVLGKTHGVLKNKIIGAIAVAWYRHSGIETTLLSIYHGGLGLEMIPASTHQAGAFFGAGLVSSIGGAGKISQADKLQALKDEEGLVQIRVLVQRMIELARIVKIGLQELNRNNVEPYLIPISPLARRIKTERSTI